MTAKHLANSLLDFGVYLEQRGQRPGKFLQQMGFPAEILLGSNVWIDRDTVLDFTHAIARSTGDPIPGFHGGALFELDNYGDWVFRAGQCGTLGEALRYTALNLHQLETGTRMTFRRSGDTAVVRSELVGRMAADPRHQYEGHLCVLVKLLRLAGNSFSVRMHLPHECGHTARAQDLAGLEVIDGTGHAEVAFDAGALELPLSPASISPARKRGPAEEACRQVTREILEAVDPAELSAARIAASTALNLRTMQRRLSAWGFSFEEILDSYRKRCARELLLCGEATITDIAHGLGYSDSAHFTRAVRRWYGVSPRALRRDGVAVTALTWSRPLRAPKAAGRTPRPSTKGADKVRRV